MEASRAQSNGHLVDVNSASTEALSQGINGIGPVLAQRIVDRRLAQGPFATLHQLVDIEGIGEVLLQRITGQITLGTQPSALIASPVGVSVPLVQAGEDAMGAGTSDNSVRSELEQDAEPIEETTGDQATAAPETLPEERPESPAEMSEPLEPEDTPEGISAAVAGELEQEINAAAPELAELGLYTRTLASDSLSAWTPASALSDEEEESFAGLEPDEPTWLMDVEEEPMPTPATPPAVPVLEQAVAAAQPLPEPEPAAAPAWDEPVLDTPKRTLAATAPSAPAAPPAAETSPKREGMGFWRSLWLVLLGGLLGVVLTLAIAIIWSGTLDFASQPQVDAISRNVGTMQANQELAWQRIDELTVGSQELARKVAQLEQLRDTVGQLQTSLQQAEQELANTQASLDVLGEDVAQLRSSTEAALSQLDERVGTNEQAITTLDATVTELEDAFAVVEKRVGAFDGFFSSLRDLLIEMQGIPESTEAAAPADGAIVVGPAAPLEKTEPAPSAKP